MVCASSAHTATVVPATLSTGSAARNVLYEDDAIGALGSIDTSRTLLSQLCGRLRDDAFNARVIHTTRALNALAHAVALVYLATVLSVFVVSDSTARTILSSMCCASGAFLLVYVSASLSWDMLVRLVPTFEFWFLFAINAFNGAMWTLIFDDDRRIVLLVTGALYVTLLGADANVHTRPLVTRILVIGSPAVPVVLAMIAFQVAPDVKNPSLHVWGVALDTVDFEVTGSLIIGFFTAQRVNRTQHLVFSRKSVARVECDMFLPLCHLVPQPQRHKSRLLSRAVARSLGPRSSRQPLQLVDDRAAHGIDVTKRLIPWFPASFPPYVLNACGTIGLVSWAATPLLRPIDVTTSPSLDPLLALQLVSCAASLVFVLCYVSQYQPALTRRITLEIDAWFVSLHTTLVALAASDAFHWDVRCVLVTATGWLWGHWILYLDAVTPTARRRLVYSRRLTLLIAVVLFAHPIGLGAWVYLSSVRSTLQNRVLLDVSFGRHQRLRIDVLGFLASKLFTLWVWTGRFLWRELLRPADAYKLIKRHAQYKVPVWT